MTTHVDPDTLEILYALEEPEVMLPYAMCRTASQARYRGWKELDAIGYTDYPFDPRTTTAHVRYMRRFTNDPFSELTHRFCEPGEDGAIKVWHVVVGDWLAPPRPRG